MINDKDLLERLTARQGAMEKRRAPYEEDWDDIIDFVQPNREAFREEEEGMREATRIYDGTAPGAHRILTNGMSGYATSRHMAWFKMFFSDSELNEFIEAKEWLELLERHMYSVFQDSNFYEQLYAYYSDVTSVATATMFIEDERERKRPYFSTRHPFESYIEQNRFQEVDTVHRKYFMPAREIPEQFGKENCSKEVLDDLKNDPDKRHVIVHCAFKNTQEIMGELSKTWKYASIYYEEDRAQKILERKGYLENPYAVWRWSVSSRELYGRGCSHEALVEIEKANEMGKTMLKGAHMSVESAYMIPERLYGRTEIFPGGRNYMRPNEKIEAIHPGINYPVGIDREERATRIIREAYYVDMFLLLAQQYTQTHNARRTATEVVKMEGEQTALMSAILGRLQSEALEPIFSRVFAIERRAGRLPDMPPVLQDYGGASIRIRYVGPLFQAQNRIYRTQGPLLAAQNGFPIIAAREEVGDNVDWDFLFREIWEGSGAPAKSLKSSREVKKIRAMRAQQMAAQQQMMQAQAEAEMAPKLAKAPEAGSPLERVEKEAANALANVGAGEKR